MPLSLLPKCSTLLHLKSIHSQLTTLGLTSQSPSPTFIKLLYALTTLPSPSPSYASSLFLRIPSPSAFPYNLLIRTHLLLSSPVHALCVFVQMRLSSVSPDSHTFPFALKACAALGRGYEFLCRGLHAQALLFGYHDDVFVMNNLVSMYVSLGWTGDARRVFDEAAWRDVVSYNSLIDGYVKGGDLDMARKVFDEMLVRNVVSCGTLLAGYSRCGRFEDAFELFDWMVAGGMRPDDAALVSVLSSCARLGELSRGRCIHEYMRFSGIEMNVYLMTALVDMYAKCGCISIAINMFESSKHRNLFTWNAIIVGLAAHGQGRLSLDYFFRMQEAGVQADGITFLGVLMGCSHAGLVNVARGLFDEMEGGYGVQKELKHYGCMSDMLGRAGLIAEAVKMIRGMPMAGDMYVWGGLLGGCRIHGNVKVAEIAVRHLLELNPEDSGVYSIMANIYANARRWEDAERIRKFLSHSNMVKKNKGCSSLC